MSAAQQELLESALRASVAAANMFAAWSTARASLWLSKEYRPHLYFVTLWSVVSGACMTVLALGPPLSYTIEILNLAALFMVGGWATLIARLTRDTRQPAASQRSTRRSTDE